jgi:hypothetical protein
MNSSISSSRSGLCAAFVGSAVLAVWLTGLGLSYATGRLDYSEPKLHESLSFHGEHLDVVFLGNSLTLEGVSPRSIDASLGTHSYNFALGGASLLESEMQLRHYLANNPAPKVIALGIYLDAEARYAGIAPTLYYELNPELRKIYWRRSRTLQGQGFDRGFVFFNLFPAYRYRGVVDLILKWLVSREDTRPRFVRGQAQANFSRAAVELGLAHRSDFPVEELRSFLSFCQENSLRVLLFEPPMTPGEPELTLNRQAVLDEVSRAVADFANASFVTFGTSGNTFDKTDWVNLNHLNKSGADKFSKELARALWPLVK